ncbi:YdcH family protein [Rhizobium sp. SG2393]|uniref:YdcH family protein n=1 Tax=Rhizobium sp. SG2393 TaxID=3276279 RepID=UPI00366AE0FA
MSNTPHELAEDFPQHVAAIRHLRATDGHFHRITEAYHEVNRALHRAETDIEPADDLRMQDMRKRRMALKDEIYGLLSRPEAVPDPVP